MKRRDLVLGAPALLAPSVLLGAAAPPAPTPRYPLADEALVYFYHQRTKDQDGRAFWMQVDDRKVAKLEVNEYSFVYLPPGQHIGTVQLGLELFVRQTPQQFSVTVDGGQIYYFRFTTRLDYLGGLAGMGRRPPPQPSLQEVPRDMAKIGMRLCTYRAPEPDWPLTR